MAYALSESSFIYPITPATTMGELMDSWISQGRKNVWGNQVHLRMLQSEGGAAAACHGAAAAGSLCSTFTASQGFLLMIPDLYKIAAEYCPTVIHVAARSLALSALSIYNDHGDIYAGRSTGMPFLCSNSVQEAQDLAAIAHLTMIKTGLPFVHFFDGFRTSHEINTYEEISNNDLYKLVDEQCIARIRARSMNPEHPTQRGTIMPPEFAWQSIEAPNKDYAKLPGQLAEMMNKFGKLTGRYYKPMQYVGTQNDEAVIIMMGSGCDTVEEYIRTHPQEKIGLVKIHLYRPFSIQLLNDILPLSVKKVCVLDKVHEVTSHHEPLYVDVVSALHGQRQFTAYGGRYGISSKDFAPQHVTAIAKNLLSETPKDGFTVGIDQPETALPVGKPTDYLPSSTKQCIFWGLGSDGTVGANKQAIKLIVSNTKMYGQAYFAYSAHKSGGTTTSHIRFGEKPIDAPYFVQQADYIACHNPAYLKKFNMIHPLKQNGVFVINVPADANLDELILPSVRKELAEKNARIYAIDATAVAASIGMAGRINMLMQTVFFHLSGVLPAEKYIPLLKQSIAKQYARKGKDVIAKNQLAVDKALEGLKEIKYDRQAWLNAKPEEGKGWTDFGEILEKMIKQEGDQVPVSKMPQSGIVKPGMSKFEKRGIAVKIPKWDQDKCIQCNTCSILCPHATIRPFLLTEEESEGMNVLDAKGFKDLKYRICVAPIDCMGCGVCAQACPAQALTMTKRELIDKQELENWNKVISVPNRGHLIKKYTVRGSQFQQPLLEFNGACPGCGETAMIKLITQLYGDKLYLACATGCSLVWGASFPWNPYTTNAEGRGPTWANSLFEDGAEFGYGIVHGVQARRNLTKNLINEMLQKNSFDNDLTNLFNDLLKNWEDVDKSNQIADKIKPLLLSLEPKTSEIARLQQQADILGKKIIWIMGGDGWAYDIGYGGLDHVLASGEDVNVIVLDTEVYSNTGGQCSKATQRGAVANFSAAGYTKCKKDLAAIAMTYNNIYVASTCLLANQQQALKAIQEATEYKGPSLIINYSPCINHGIKKGLTSGPQHCKDLVKSGYIILFRYDPRTGKLHLDSKKPDFEMSRILKTESRFTALTDLFPKEAEIKFPELKNDLQKRYEHYAALAKK